MFDAVSLCQPLSSSSFVVVVVVTEEEGA